MCRDDRLVQLRFTRKIPTGKGQNLKKDNLTFLFFRKEYTNVSMFPETRL